MTKRHREADAVPDLSASLAPPPGFQRGSGLASGTVPSHNLEMRIEEPSLQSLFLCVVLFLLELGGLVWMFGLLG